MRSPMRFTRLCLSSLAAVALLCPAAMARSRSPRLRSVHTWAFAIGDGDLAGNVVTRYAGYDLVVLDGQEAGAGQVRALRQAGKVVLAYLDVGTIEPGRPWYRRARPYQLNYWPDWGEWYADVDAPGFRRLISRRVAPAMLRKGFSGLFLDNTDMVQTHPRQRQGMGDVVRGLARLVHSEHEFLFAQNGEDTVGPLLHYYDGWNREDVSATYDFGSHRYVRQGREEIAQADRALRRIARAGLLTLATDYTAAGDTIAARAAVSNACGAGALPFVSDIGLTRIPATPARCP